MEKGNERYEQPLETKGGSANVTANKETIKVMNEIAVLALLSIDIARCRRLNKWSASRNATQQL